MSVRSGQSVTVEFITSASTGAATNADSLPTGTLVVNGTDNGASVTVTNVDTGRYKAAVTLPTLAVGDIVQLLIAATVATIAGKGFVWTDTKDQFAGAVPDVIAGGTGGLFIAGTNAATTVTTSFTTTFTGNLTGSVASVTADVGITQAGADKVWGTTTRLLTAGTNIVLAKGVGVTGFNDITAAAAATAVWQDTTPGDFTVDTSPGKIIFTQLGGTFTTTSSSVFSTAALANAPAAATVSQIATAVWQDATAGDFTAASSIGKSLYTGVVPGAAGGLFIAGTNAATTVTTSFTTTFTGNLTGSVGSVTGDVDGNVAGSVLGSVSGNLGGNVVGSVGQVLGNVGGNLVGSVGSLTTAALAQMFTVDSGETFGDAVAGSVVFEIAENSGGGGGGTVTGFTAGALAQFFTLDTGETFADAVDGSVVAEIANNSGGGGGEGGETDSVMSTRLVTTGLVPLVIGSDFTFILSADLNGLPWDPSSATITLLLRSPEGVQSTVVASMVGRIVQAVWTVQGPVGNWTRAWEIVDPTEGTQISPPIVFSVTESP